MKGLLTLAMLIPAFWMISVPASADEGIRQDRAVVADTADERNPVVLATSWNVGGKHGYYGRWDHRHRGHPGFDRHRGNFHFDKHRHGNIHRFHGHRHFQSPHKPYPFYGKGHYYSRYPRGGFFGFSTCYRSGSVLVCVNQSHPYR